MIENFDEFTKTLSYQIAPPAISVYLKALWHDAKNDWETAHNLIDDLEDKSACWVHAYLHRKEGDIANANYWYNKANKNTPLISLQEEWNNLVTYFLNESSTT